MADPRVTERMPPAPPSERMQRLRVGITGLAAVVLIVLLATAIASGVQRSALPSQNATQAVGAPAPMAAPAKGTDPKSDPLAQLGVAPGGVSDNAKQPGKTQH